MDSLKNNPYVQDVLSQGDALQSALTQYDDSPIRGLADEIHRFDRILLTGMGGSYHASYPALLLLANAGLPAMLVDSAELVHHCRGLITPRTLVWAVSQSGRSAEIITVIELARQAEAALLATVNDPASPLARAAGATIRIHAAVEQTVSTRTYLNTLAVNQLAALRFARGDVRGGLAELTLTARGVTEYLNDWESHLQLIIQRVGQPQRMVLLGRGPSLASANAGALVLSEAAKFAAIGMQTGEFRHGPLELAGPDLSVLLFDGPPETRELNRRLHEELLEIGAPAHWIAEKDEDPSSLPRPRAEGIGLPLAEIVPIQILSIHLGLAKGVEPGKFFRVGKVTLKE